MIWGTCMCATFAYCKHWTGSYAGGRSAQAILAKPSEVKTIVFPREPLEGEILPRTEPSRESLSAQAAGGRPLNVEVCRA